MVGRSAKSHRHHYYVCNASFKQGKMSCDAKALPKDKFERVVIQQVREKVLNEEWLDELVEMVNEELGSTHSALGERVCRTDAELRDVGARLSRLYEALETGKLSLDDLAPRIKEHRERESELSKTRLRLEAEMLVKGPNRVDGSAVNAHARDLKAILEEADILAGKAFLRSFIKRIEVKGSEAVIHYTLPMPPNMNEADSVSVLPIMTPGGEGGNRTPTPCGTGS